MSIVGRGEERAVEILSRLFPEHEIYTQYPIKKLISTEEFCNLGHEHNQHKHDIVLEKNGEYIVIEVDYKHGKVAQEKWDNVYQPRLIKAGHKTCTIDDSECISLFDLNGDVHIPLWQDYIDVIEALKTGGIMEPDVDD